MPGPAPKPASERRRRNQPSGGEWITLPHGPYDGPKPKLPSRLVEGRKPLAATVEEWDRWWRSPMAFMWQEADWSGLVHLATLVEQYNRTYDAKILTEIRLQRDLYGLTPKGRQSLRWRLPVDDESGEPEARPSSRYSGLRVVDPN